MRDPKIRKFFESIGYPKEWIEEGQKYSLEHSYVAFDPEWALEPIPPLPKKQYLTCCCKEKIPIRLQVGTLHNFQLFMLAEQ